MLTEISCFMNVIQDLTASIKKLKIPPIRSKELTNRVCRALKDCMQVSTVLKCIELQGLPLRQRDTELLVKVGVIVSYI